MSQGLRISRSIASGRPGLDDVGRAAYAPGTEVAVGTDRANGLPLARLADEINREHELCFGHQHSAAAHALRCGELLAQAKARVGHGRWLPWLAANFAGSERTAQLYLRAHHRYGQDPQRVADLPARPTLRLLTAPERATRAADALLGHAAQSAALSERAAGEAGARMSHEWVGARSAELQRVSDELGRLRDLIEEASSTNGAEPPQVLREALRIAEAVHASLAQLVGTDGQIIDVSAVADIAVGGE